MALRPGRPRVSAPLHSSGRTSARKGLKQEEQHLGDCLQLGARFLKHLLDP